MLTVKEALRVINDAVFITIEQVFFVPFVSTEVKKMSYFMKTLTLIKLA